MLRGEESFLNTFTINTITISDTINTVTKKNFFTKTSVCLLFVVTENGIGNPKASLYLIKIIAIFKMHFLLPIVFV